MKYAVMPSIRNTSSVSGLHVDFYQLLHEKLDGEVRLNPDLQSASGTLL
jgi:hypothetical protein